ncbi:MAG: prepilin peptidase, partial [Candidatus Colwellbacteria bacterium]|nr:prepilin peptidase [Candidatus Colwellbacteria bacterium]
MIVALIGMLGLIVGSFLNVVIMRHSTGSSVLKGRSRCFACGHVLEWHELIPLASFFIQKGHCRACSTRISWQYPIVELLTGMLFFLVWLKATESGIMNYESWFINYGLLVTGYWLSFFSLLIVIAVYDFRTKIIPDRFVYPLIIFGIGYALLFSI